MQVRRVRDLVDEHRASLAALFLIRAEHEVVEAELPASFEQIEQARLPAGTVEHVRLVDAHDRQAPALGSERVVSTGELLFLRAQLLERGLPLCLRNDSWEIHPDLLRSGTGDDRLGQT